MSFHSISFIFLILSHCLAVLVFPSCDLSFVHCFLCHLLHRTVSTAVFTIYPHTNLLPLHTSYCELPVREWTNGRFHEFTQFNSVQFTPFDLKHSNISFCIYSIFLCLFLSIHGSDQWTRFPFIVFSSPFLQTRKNEIVREVSSFMLLISISSHSILFHLNLYTGMLGRYTHVGIVYLNWDVVPRKYYQLLVVKHLLISNQIAILHTLSA